MRRRAAVLSAAAALLLITSYEASATPRGGFRAGPRFAPIVRHGGFARLGLNRFAVARHHHRFNRFNRFPAPLGFGFWPYGYGYEDGYPVSQVSVEQNVAAGGAPYGYPSLYDLPAVAGIRNEPAASPVIYVIHGAGHRGQGLIRKGEHPPSPKILSTKDGPETTAAVPASVGPGARIVEVTVPR